MAHPRPAPRVRLFLPSPTPPAPALFPPCGRRTPRPLHNLVARPQNPSFPMVGKKFSNGWKIPPVFPTIGKNFRQFSNDWKKCFQWLENFFPACGASTRRRGRHGGAIKNGKGRSIWQLLNKTLQLNHSPLRAEFIRVLHDGFCLRRVNTEVGETRRHGEVGACLHAQLASCSLRRSSRTLPLYWK